MQKKPKEFASDITIMIVHKNHEKIENLSLFFKDQGFVCHYAKSGLEAIKKFEAEEIKTLIIQENNLPINAYKTIAYIKTELNKNPYCVILKDSEDGEINDSKELDLIDRFYLLGEDLDGLLRDISGEKKNEVTDQNNSCYSLDYLNEISGNSEEFIEESLELFSLSVGKEIRDLYIKIKNQDYEEIRKIAHKIKPSFAMVENPNGIEICDQITYKAKEGELKTVIDDLHAEFLKIKQALKTDYPNLNL